MMQYLFLNNCKKFVKLELEIILNTMCLVCDLFFRKSFNGTLAVLPVIHNQNHFLSIFVFIVYIYYDILYAFFICRSKKFCIGIYLHMFCLFFSRRSTTFRFKSIWTQSSMDQSLDLQTRSILGRHCRN